MASFRRLWAITLGKDGKLRKREILKRADTIKKYDQYIKDAETGLFLKKGYKNLDKIQKLR